MSSDSTDKAPAGLIKATHLIKVVGIFTIIFFALLMPDSSGVRPAHSHGLLMSAALLLFLQFPLHYLQKHPTTRTGLLILLSDLLLSINCFFEFGSGHFSFPFLYLVPLSLLQASVFLDAKRQLLGLAVCLTTSSLAQFFLLAPSMTMTGSQPGRILLQFIDLAGWPNFASFTLAFAFVGYCLHFALTSKSTEPGRVTPQALASILLIGWTLAMLALNSLGNTVKYHGELLVESNMHHTSLVLAVLLLLVLRRIRRPLTLLLVSAIAAFFVTVACVYSFVNGFQFVYFMALVLLALNSSGIKGKLCMVMFIASALLAVQVNAHAIFVDAPGGASHALLLPTYTVEEILGTVVMLAMVAVTARLAARQKQ